MAAFKVTDATVERIMEESVIVEIEMSRYGIKKQASTDSIEFKTPEQTQEDIANREDEPEEQEESLLDEVVDEAFDLNAPAPVPTKTRTVKVAKVKKAMFTVRKKLFDSREWQAIKNYDQQTYRWLQERALKSNLRRGCYRLPLALFGEVEEFLTQRMAERLPLVEEFVEALPRLQRQAARDLTVAYNPADYDTSAKVRASFSMDYSILEEVAPTKLKRISRVAYEREAKKAKQKVAREVEAMVEEVRGGFAKLISHAVEKLTPNEDGTQRQFKASTLENINEFLNLFEARNLAGDVELAKLAKRAREIMQGVDAQTLRQDETAREAIRRGFAQINTQMDKMIKDKSNRKIRTLTE